MSITHPIDYCKVCLQKREAPVLRRCYAGVTSRWCSVLPMRGVLWTAKQHGAHMHHKSLFEKCTVMGSMCGAIQSVVDCPIENVKLQKMAGAEVNYSPQRLSRGFSVNCARNILLCTGIMAGALGTSTSYGLLAGSIAGCVLSQPFDYLKTMVQSREGDVMKALRIRDCMRGWHTRAIMTPINVCISYQVFQFLL